MIKPVAILDASYLISLARNDKNIPIKTALEFLA